MGDRPVVNLTDAERASILERHFPVSYRLGFVRLVNGVVEYEPGMAKAMADFSFERAALGESWGFGPL